MENAYLPRVAPTVKDNRTSLRVYISKAVRLVSKLQPIVRPCKLDALS